MSASCEDFDEVFAEGGEWETGHSLVAIRFRIWIRVFLKPTDIESVVFARRQHYSSMFVLSER